MYALLLSRCLTKYDTQSSAEVQVLCVCTGTQDQMGMSRNLRHPVNLLSLTYYTQRVCYAPRR